MSGRSVRAFTMAGRKRAIVNPIQIVREYFIVLVKRNNKLNAKYLNAIWSLNMQVKISLVPQERQHGKIVELFVLYNFQSLAHREYGDRSFSFSKNCS